MLVVNPEKRYTMLQVCKHSWMTLSGPDEVFDCLVRQCTEFKVSFRLTDVIETLEIFFIYYALMGIESWNMCWCQCCVKRFLNLFYDSFVEIDVFDAAKSPRDSCWSTLKLCLGPKHVSFKLLVFIRQTAVYSVAHSRFASKNTHR